MHSVDRFDEESEHQVTVTDRSNRTPLLEGNTAETTGSSAEP
jgi:hypothetical protein